MRDSTKNTLRQIAFFFGVLLTGTGVILIGLGGFSYNPHLKEDADPFVIPLSLSGAEARTEFMATKTAAYEVSIDMPMPPRIFESWDKCPSATYHAPDAACPSIRQLTTEWSIADTDDSQWHDWERYSPIELSSSGYGDIGGFRARAGHRYIVTVRVMPGDPELRGATAQARAYLSDKGDQLSNAFGNLWSSLALLASVPFFVIGIPLVLVGRGRKRHAAGEPGAA